ncbi:hypothetical protein LER55_33025, partial [Pseudomonas aeruginosa]|uniref:hypothetical protein n=1 Tax=Pseudomonas aeruginosa TaxID=287 RepID=UPI0038925186
MKRSVLGRVAAQQIVGEGLLLHRLRLLRKSPSTQALNIMREVVIAEVSTQLSEVVGVIER